MKIKTHAATLKITLNLFIRISRSLKKSPKFTELRNDQRAQKEVEYYTMRRHQCKMSLKVVRNLYTKWFCRRGRTNVPKRRK